MGGLAEVIVGILALCEVKAGERVVLYTGQEFDSALLEEYTAALKSMDADFLRVVAHVRDRDGQMVNPGAEPLACELFKAADMVVYVLPQDAYWGEGIPRVAQLHTPAFRRVREENPRLRWLQVGLPHPEINYRRLLPSDQMLARTRAGAAVMEAAEWIRLESPNGTSFRCRKEIGTAGHQIGIVNSEHTWDNYGCGNVSCHPTADSAEGVIVVSPGDHWHHTRSPEALSIVRDTIRLHFEGGLLVKIEGGAEAKLIERSLSRYSEQGVRRVAHIGWGTHDGAVWVEDRLFSVADWEGAYGSLMIHLGGYAGLGGPHFSGPTVVDHSLWLDDELIVDGGTIVSEVCR